ncbi:hypothetical protein QL285_033374 [Trifolium repens]|nr:hypothetical protein QL285_033374 [Trifolium repens]
MNFELNFSAHTSQYLFNHAYNLEELVLKMCCCAIKVPPSLVGDFSFGNLKVIKLCGIIFTIDESRVIRLPVLNKFETENCSWLSAHDVTIEAPLLESVLIEQDRMSVFRRSCKIKFFASCIKEFTYRGSGGISQPIVLSNSSAALKCIKFDASQVLTHPNVAMLPKFPMLSHLELGCVTDVVLLRLLQKSSVLNTLLFKVPRLSKFIQELLDSAVVPDCLTSTLQVVKFENVRGTKHELFLAKYFMENGMVLERMSFSLANAELSKSKVIEEFKEKLYSFKKGLKGVSFAILEFYY